jgi:dephospho-CoA kinase
VVIGLIGGSGSGKSEVANVLKEDFGAYIITADKIGHDVIKRGTKSYERLVEFFGDDIIGYDREIDRTILGKKAFSSESNRAALNTMTRPYIGEEILRIIREQKEMDENKVIVVDAEGLVEANMTYFLDEVWSVYAPIEIRKRRLIENRGFTVEKIDSIINNQSNEEYYKMNSCFQIVNDSTVDNIKKQINNRWSFGGKQ